MVMSEVWTKRASSAYKKRKKRVKTNPADLKQVWFQEKMGAVMRIVVE